MLARSGEAWREGSDEGRSSRPELQLTAVPWTTTSSTGSARRWVGPATATRATAKPVACGGGSGPRCTVAARAHGELRWLGSEASGSGQRWRARWPAASVAMHSLLFLFFWQCLVLVVASPTEISLCPVGVKQTIINHIRCGLLFKIDCHYIIKSNIKA